MGPVPERHAAQDAAVATDTNQALADLSDPGRFERLATAVLYEFDPRCTALTHPGVNATGKTRKSPLDNIGFVPGTNPPHLIAVHHTTARVEDLERKWLHDPATVRPRKGGKPTAPPGDLIKTAHIVEAERKRSPDLQATLILTTNAEPPEALIRDVQAAGRAHGIEVDVWSRSRLATTSTGLPANGSGKNISASSKRKSGDGRRARRAPAPPSACTQ